MPFPFPLIEPDQDQLAIPLNNFSLYFNSWTNGVIDRSLTTPPANPSSRGFYIFQAPATGIATGKEQQLAWYSSTGEWFFLHPTDGQIVASNFDDGHLIYRLANNTWEELYNLNRIASNFNPQNYSISTNDVLGHLSGIDAAIGLVLAPPSVITLSSNSTILSSGGIYRARTNANPLTVTLPANPVSNAPLTFFDADGSDPSDPTGFGKNSLIILRNNNTIQGLAEDLAIDSENASLTLIYNAESSDWELRQFSVISPTSGNSVSGAELIIDTAIAIPQSLSTVVEWDSATFDENNYSNLDADSTKITISKSGKYSVFVQISFATTSTSSSHRSLQLLKNNSITLARIDQNAIVNGSTTLICPFIGRLSAGDYLKVAVSADESTSLNIINNYFRIEHDY